MTPISSELRTLLDDEPVDDRIVDGGADERVLILLGLREIMRPLTPRLRKGKV